MTYEQWLEFVLEGAAKFQQGDASQLEGIARQLTEVDKALTLMEKYHYRVSSQGLLKPIKLMLSELGEDV